MSNIFQFNWADVVPEEVLSANDSHLEDEIYGLIEVKAISESRTEQYMVDIHHFYYSGRDRGYDLEVYTSDEDFQSHHNWLDGLLGIKTTTSFKHFRRRAENMIAAYLAEELQWTEYGFDSHGCIC